MTKLNRMPFWIFLVIGIIVLNCCQIATATVGTVEITSSVSSNITSGAVACGSSAFQIDDLYFANMGAMEIWENTYVIIPDGIFSGSLKATYTSYVENVDLKVGATTVGKARIGYYSPNQGTTWMIWMSPQDDGSGTYWFDPNPLTGAQHVRLSNYTAAAFAWATEGAGLAGVGDYDSLFVDYATSGFCGGDPRTIPTTTHYTSSFAEYSANYEYNSLGNLKSFLYERSNTNPALLYIIDNGDNSIINETVFGTPQDSDFEFLGNPYSGNNTWYINVTTAFGVESGLFSITFIPQSPITSSSIEWNADVYVEKTLGDYNYSIDDYTWGNHIYSTLKTNLYKDPTGAKTLIKSYTIGTLQSARVYVTLQAPGAYSIELVGYETEFDLRGTVLDVDTVNVLPVGEYLIFTNVTQITPKATFELNYLFPTITDSQRTGIRSLRFVGNKWTPEKTWTFYDLGTTTTNTLYSESVFYALYEGNYIFEIYSETAGSIIQTPIIESIASGNTPIYNYSMSSITINKVAYHIGETMSGRYIIDGTNFSNYGVYLQSYSVDNDAVMSHCPLSVESDTFYGALSLTDEGIACKYDGLTPVAIGDMEERLYGINASNSSDTLIIATVSYSVGSTTANGYGISLSKYSACQMENIIASFTVPIAARVTIIDPDGYPVKSVSINQSTTITYQFPKEGIYEIRLSPATNPNSAEIIASISIENNCDGTGIIDTQPGEAETLIYTNLLNFFMLPAFWGIIIWIGVSGGMLQRSESQKAAGIISFLFLQLLLIVGLFAPYTMYVAVISWIVVAIAFKLGQNVSNVD